VWALPSLASCNLHANVSRFLLCGRAELVLRAWIGNYVVARSRAARVAPCVFCIVRVVFVLILFIIVIIVIIISIIIIMVEFKLSRPHQSFWQDLLLDTVSHEKSVEHLGHASDRFSV